MTFSFVNQDDTLLHPLESSSSVSTFKSLFHGNPAALALTSTDGIIIDVNDLFARLTDSEREALIGTALTDLLFREDEQAAERWLNQSQAFDHVEQHEIRFPADDGDTRTLLISSRIIDMDGTAHILSTATDISKQKSLETTLRESEESFLSLLNAAQRQTQEQQLLNQIRTMLAEQVDLDKTLRAVVEGIAETYGYTLVSLYLLENGRMRLQHYVGYPTVIQEIPLSTGVTGRVVRTGKPVLLTDVREDPDFLAAIDGIVSEICVPLFDGDEVVGTLNVESIYGYTLTEQDLAFMTMLSEHIAIAIHRARLYEALRQSRDQYQLLIDNINQVIFEIDIAGRFTFVNRAWAQLTGYSAEETIGREVYDFVHPDDRLRCLKSFRYLLNVPDAHTTGQLRLDTAYGTTVIVQVDARRTYSDPQSRSTVSGTLSDITERVLAEQRESEQRRLAEALRATAADLTTTLDVQEMLTMVFAHLRSIMPRFDGLRVMLVENRTAYMLRVDGYSEGRVPPPPHTILPIDTIPAWARMYETGEPYVIEDMRTQPGRVVLRELEWVRSLIGAPLRAKERVIGFIHLDSAHVKRFQPIHAQWLQAFADQAGTALQNAQLYEATVKHAQELEERVAERTAKFRQTKEQVETILNTSSDSIVLLDSHGRIRQSNPAFSKMMGYSSDELFDKSLAAMVSETSRELMETSLQRVLQQHLSERFEIDIQRIDGTVLTVEAAFDPIRRTDYEDSSAVCTLHDITERRRMENELREALEKERRIVELKNRFGAMVSHEFRTPLSTIKSATETLRLFHNRVTEKRRNSLLQMIDTQVEHLISLLEDILTISKADTLGMDFDPQQISASAFCESLIDEFRQMLGDSHPVLFAPLETDTMLWVDKQLLRRILSNLLTNAAKYSPYGKPIRVSLSQSDGYVNFVVEDQGIGIPPQDSDRLFQTFHRATNVGTIPGTGLGLAIVKRAVEMHNGIIEVESEVGSGTRFTIRLPITEEPLPPPLINLV